ncbi:hypothetical protein RCK52_25335, partial [Salmonella enterica subsp. enterica serovar 1,4,[5],12:i:-]
PPPPHLTFHEPATTEIYSRQITLFPYTALFRSIGSTTAQPDGAWSFTPTTIGRAHDGTPDDSSGRAGNRSAKRTALGVWGGG